MPRRQAGRACTALVGLTGIAVLVSGATYAALPDPGSAAAWTVAAQQLRASPGTVTGALLPGGSASGTLFLRNPSTRAVRLTALELAPATTTAPGCRSSGVELALVTAPTAAAPLIVPGRTGRRDGTALVGYTAFLDVDADVACRGAVVRSEVVATVVGRRGRVVLGAATATAGTLPRPPAPSATRTTGTTVHLRWSAPADLPAGAAWLVERAPYGSDAWTAACGSGPAPLAGTSCVDTGLTPGRRWSYRVTAAVGRWRATGPPGPQVRTLPGPG